ncbi:acetate--CoA ligase family protein [Frankia sp. CiP3]|uniref:acetate--CoA ligase family protein n=1 Tax=Frankia sp. CiP3 TaxID=2880971 RepID=UPI001EF3FFC0|nr:acetate--CoA ligase family protein [Frankia sp. CiP3]
MTAVASGLTGATTTYGDAARALLHARNVAIIGASEKNRFSILACQAQQELGAMDRTWLVNPRTPEVFGTATVASCTEVTAPLDAVFVAVPRAGVVASLRDAAAAGARAAVILASGYGESGVAGRRAQDELVSAASELGIALLGPNMLGFANLSGGVALAAMPGVIRPAGHVALISQSGAVAGTIVLHAIQQNIALSHVVTTGNEAMITIADVLDAVLDDESVRSVAIFAETIRDTRGFRSAAARAADREVPIVMLKAGTSELAARTAAAHTGALVGDDRVVDAALGQCGVIRVRTFEELVGTADLLAHTGAISPTGVAAASISGGACDVLADLAAPAGLNLPELHPSTVAALGELLPDSAGAQNPLDVTGMAMRDPGIWLGAVRALGKDPGIGLVLGISGIPTERTSGSPGFLTGVTMGGREAGVPVAIVSTCAQAVTDPAVKKLTAVGSPPHLLSLDVAATAAAGVSRWSQWLAARPRPRTRPPGRAASQPKAEPGAGRWSEWAARKLLIDAGVPVVPARLVHSRDEAVAAAIELGLPVAVKVVSSTVAHKSDIGGVVLGVADADGARVAFDQVCRAAGDNAVEGVLVAPMRGDGLELIVGVVRDPQWGPVIAMGLGGVLVEVLRDSAVRVLPIGAAEAAEALRTLSGAALLDGVRGRPGVNVPAVAEVIARIGQLALALGENLESLEVNPLLARGDEIEALDALVTWADA